MRRLRYSVPYIAGKNLPKDSDPAPRGAGQSCGAGRPNWPNFNPPAPCGAGPLNINAHLQRAYFNPPAPCGAGHLRGVAARWARHFNPPALAGRDCGPTMTSYGGNNFNPPALAGRDIPRKRITPGGEISIHPPLRGGTAILHKKTVQNIAYCTKSAFTLAVLSGFLALMRPFFLPNVHKFRCEPSEESLLAPRSHAYTIRTPSG